MDRKIFNDLIFFIKTEILTVVPKDFSEKSNLISLGLDSIKLIRLVSYVETKFNLCIPDEAVNFDNMSSIEKIRKIVINIQNGRAN